jgi:hypothetical protein
MVKKNQGENGSYCSGLRGESPNRLLVEKSRLSTFGGHAVTIARRRRGVLLTILSVLRASIPPGGSFR